MYRHIVVAVDGPEHAIPLAADLAKRASATLDIVHVFLPPVPVGDLPIDPSFSTVGIPSDAMYSPVHVQELREIDRRQVESLATHVTNQTGVSATPVQLEGDVTNAIVRHAHERGADLIVMTTHARRGLSRAILGSVAQGVVRQADCPVLLVRHHDTDSQEVDVDTTFDIAPVPAIKHILVPVDGSPVADSILPHALAFAGLMKARVTLVGVIDPMLGIAAPLTDTGDTPTSLTDSILDVEAAKFAAAGIEAETVIVQDRHTADAIAAVAKERGADLIAMATHGRGMLGRLFLGSVADGVLQASTVPLLIYRASRVEGE